MYIPLIVAGVLIGLCLVFRKKDREFIGRLKKKEHPLKPVYPLASVMFTFICRLGGRDLFGSEEEFSRLYPGAKPAEILKENAYKALAYVIVIVFGTCVITALYLCTGKSPIEDGNRLLRGETGSGETEYRLTVTDGEKEREVTVSVSEQRLPEEDIDAYFDRLFALLEKAVLAENASPDEITGDVNLVKKIPGTDVTVRWEDIDFNYIYSDGRVRRDELKESVITSLTAELTYFDEVRLCTFSLRILPEEEDEEKVYLDMLQGILKDEDEASGGDRYFTLPSQVGDKEISWSAGRRNNAGTLVILGIVAALAVIPGLLAELKQKSRRRTEQMLKDYPDIVSKLVMLLTAGMTCRGAWTKICSDYAAGSSGKGREEGYAYQEMLRALNEMNLGASEAGVYEKFGIRCGVIQYQRLGTLLSKNLRRGSSDLTGMLELEAKEAFGERIENVRQRAEETGTRLLFPMLGMMCIVMAIVVVPAWMGMAV